MALVLFDTNILIDALKGYPEALQELAHWDEPAISAITWMEIYAGAKPDEVQTLDNLIKDVGFEVIQTNEHIMAGAAAIRRHSIQVGPKMALPDAIILATSLTSAKVLITRNTKDFKNQRIRVPYELVTENGAVRAINVKPPFGNPSPSEAVPKPDLSFDMVFSEVIKRTTVGQLAQAVLAIQGDLAALQKPPGK